MSLSYLKLSCSSRLSSRLDIFEIKFEPTVHPTSSSNKPVAQNPIQFTSAFQVLMSEKRQLPWLDSPPDGFLEREQRIKIQKQVNIDEYGILRLANQGCF